MKEIVNSQKAILMVLMVLLVPLMYREYGRKQIG